MGRVVLGMGALGRGALGRDALGIYIYCGRELLMTFLDVLFLPCRASFSTTFLNNCGRGEGLGTTTCLETMFGVSKALGLPHVLRQCLG